MTGVTSGKQLWNIVCTRCQHQRQCDERCCGQSGYQHIKDAVTRYYTSRRDCPLWIAFESDRRSKDGKQEEDCE